MRRSSPEPPPGSLDQRRLPVLLRRAWYGLNQAFRRRILHTGITPDQFTALRNLAEAGPAGLNQSQLTTRMSSDPNTIASLVTRLVRAGLIERAPDPRDRRAFRLKLNPAGRRKFNEVRHLALQLQDEVGGVVPDDTREEFLRLLEVVADACIRAADQVPRR